MTMGKIAKKFGICNNTVSKYIKNYMNGEKVLFKKFPIGEYSTKYDSEILEVLRDNLKNKNKYSTSRHHAH